MDTKNLTRREFIKVTSATTAALAFGSDNIIANEFDGNPYDPKGLPTRKFGSTGVNIPLIALGTGSRFCAIKEEDKALELLTFALDNGFYYWDTAHDYDYNSVTSEVRLGKILYNRRKEVFLSTKIQSRDSEEVKRHIEESLTRLNTDHLDILKVHSVKDLDDLKEIRKKGGIYDILLSMKEQGVARFIGFSGHSSSEAMTKAAVEFQFDTMLVALNHFSKDGDKFEEDAVDTAAKKKMGVMVMKVIRPRETVDSLNAQDLIKYALSLKGANGAVLGIDSMKVLKENIELVRNFRPLKESRMQEIRMSLSPFFKSRNLPWMQKEYEDGMWS